MFTHRERISNMLGISRYQKYAGFTLTELLIALGINAVIFAALIGLFAANIEHYREVINISRFNQQLQSTMDLMTMDIRRAGYWANASNDLNTGTNNNPFMVTGTDISTHLSGSCILFSYDQNGNGALPTISTTYDDERYGYRLNSSIIQARPAGATFDCTATASAWENVTDPKIVTITNLVFTLQEQSVSSGTGTSSIRIRSVDITLTGQSVIDTSVTKTLTQHIRIRNDKFVP